MNKKNNVLEYTPFKKLREIIESIDDNRVHPINDIITDLFTPYTTSRTYLLALLCDKELDIDNNLKEILLYPYKYFSMIAEPYKLVYPFNRRKDRRIDNALAKIISDYIKNYETDPAFTLYLSLFKTKQCVNPNIYPGDRFTPESLASAITFYYFQDVSEKEREGSFSRNEIIQILEENINLYTSISTFLEEELKSSRGCKEKLISYWQYNRDCVYLLLQHSLAHIFILKKEKENLSNLASFVNEELKKDKALYNLYIKLKTLGVSNPSF